jgi:hypothetical protein
MLLACTLTASCSESLWRSRAIGSSTGDWWRRLAGQAAAMTPIQERPAATTGPGAGVVSLAMYEPMLTPQVTTGWSTLGHETLLPRQKRVVDLQRAGANQNRPAYMPRWQADIGVTELSI